MRFLMICVLLTMPVLSATGCAHRASTTRTETTTTTDRASNIEPAQDTTIQTKTQTTETNTTDTPHSEGGILGGTFHVVGEILALPFRVIAGVFDAIF